MPLKLDVGLTRKVTDNNYGSRGASVNIELEVDGSLVADPTRLRERIRELFGLVRTALAEELNGGNGHAAPPIGDCRETRPPAPAGGNSRSSGPPGNGHR